jgi:Na+/H+-translocating membrane pyrophosphatase
MDIRRALVGRHPAVAVAVAVALAVLAGVVAYAVAGAGVRPVSGQSALRSLFVASVAAGGVGAAVAARYRCGALPGLLLAGAPALGFFVALALAETVPGRSLAANAGTVAAVSVGVGTPGLLAGVVVRRFRER